MKAKFWIALVTIALCVVLLLLLFLYPRYVKVEESYGEGLGGRLGAYMRTTPSSGPLLTS